MNTVVKRGPRPRRNLVLRDGIWIFRKKINGKPHRVSTGCRDYKMAERRAVEIENDLLADDFGWKKKRVPTIAEWAEHVRDEVKNDTYATMLDNLAKRWPNERLDELAFTQCQGYIKSLQAAGYAQNTVRGVHVGLATCWNYAKRDKLITDNPWSFRLLKRVARERVLTPEEQQQLWPHLKPEYQRYALTALLTGCREEEMVNIRDADINLRTKHIRIDGKGDKVRYVPMVPEVEAALVEQIRLRKAGELGLRQGPRYRVEKRIAAGYVFPHAPRAYWENITKAAIAAGIPALTVHDLRRTFGTRCAEANVPMKRLQKWMGHSTIAITAEFYIHLGEGEPAEMLFAVRQVTIAATQDGVTKKVTPPVRAGKSA
jgi:integrase